MQAGVGRRLMARRPQEASAALESIETIGRTAAEELRVVLGLLRDEDHVVAVRPVYVIVLCSELVHAANGLVPVDSLVCEDHTILVWFYC